jgi:hypothetical protein
MSLAIWEIANLGKSNGFWRVSSLWKGIKGGEGREVSE